MSESSSTSTRTKGRSTSPTSTPSTSRRSRSPGRSSTIVRLDLEPHELTTVRADANAANGMTLAPDGRLLVCEQGTLHTGADQPRRPSHGRDRDGRRRVRGLPAQLAERRRRRARRCRSGSPTRATATSRASDRRRRTATTSTASTVNGSRWSSDSFDKPNGLAFSPDEAILYVGDSGANHEPGRSIHGVRITSVRSTSSKGGGS